LEFDVSVVEGADESVRDASSACDEVFADGVDEEEDVVAVDDNCDDGDSMTVRYIIDCSLVFAEFTTVDTIVVGCTEDATSTVVSGSCDVAVVSDVPSSSSLDVLDGCAVVVSRIVLVCGCCDEELEELEDVDDDVDEDDEVEDDVLLSDRLLELSCVSSLSTSELT